MRTDAAMLAILGLAAASGDLARGAGVPEHARYETRALTSDGDPRLGRELFLDEKRTQCVVCHKVAGRGGEVGPDLTHIGGKFDRPHLIESLLEPSRQIVEGYRTKVVVTVEGEVLTGVEKSRSAETIVLLDANGQERRVRRADVGQEREQAVSLMPDGIMNALSADDFTHLVAYLESLHPGGKQSPGEGTRGGVGLPRDFVLETVATHLTGCTALETTSDGRVFVCEQTGALRVVKDGELLPEPFVTLAVDSTWERGLIGVTVDPGFPQLPYVYVCYVAEEPFPHHRVSRFTARGDVAVPGSEKVLLIGDDQTTLGGNVPAGHQGGALHFGPDGMLYVGIGEQTAQDPAQELDTFQGKLLRIGPDGTIPEDNPFHGEAFGKYRAIWARGFRNPFTFAFCPWTGEIFVNDVGGKYEEINRAVAGGNFGWPRVDHGPLQDSPFEAPIHYYPQASISGGDFGSRDLPWPDRYRGRYFFGDFVHGWIKTLDPEDPTQAAAFVTGLRRPVDLRFAVEGSLFVLLRNAWVIDGRFEGHTGSLLRIRYDPASDTAHPQATTRDGRDASSS